MSDAQSPQPGQIPVFDGHNDTILSLMGTGRSFVERADEGEWVSLVLRPLEAEPTWAVEADQAVGEGQDRPVRDTTGLMRRRDYPRPARRG